MANIAGKKVPNVLIYVLAGALVVLAVWALWPSGGDDQKMYEVPGKGLLTADEYNQYLKEQPAQTAQTSKSEQPANQSAPTAPVAPVLPVTVSEAPTADQTAGGDDQLVPEPEPVEGKKLILKLSNFEDWVNGELNLKDTDIEDVSVFGSKKAVEDFVDEYKWNDKHDFTWNVDEMAIQFANEYGDSDPAPAAFATTGTNSNIYFVALSEDGITPDFYQLDSAKDSKAEVVEKKSGEKTVYPIDQWETEDL